VAANVGLTIDASYWRQRVRDRYFGTTMASGSAIQLVGGTGSLIEDNHIHTFGGRGVFIRSGSSNNLVQNNLLRDPRVGTWPWDATKSHQEEVTGISNRGGRGNVSATRCRLFRWPRCEQREWRREHRRRRRPLRQCQTACGDDAIETDTVRHQCQAVEQH
jgi:hypothetical protein